MAVAFKMNSTAGEKEVPVDVELFKIIRVGSLPAIWLSGRECMSLF